MPPGFPSRTTLALLLGLALAAPARGDLPKVPDGFKIRLVAAVPAVSYPCQLATAPDGSLFVGEDPMDQVGPADKPIDRVLVFRPGKDPVVFAEGLNAVFGMLWHDGSLYVMNMPNLTILRDTDGDGKADVRKELFTDMGVGPGFPNMLNDHIVSGIQVGMDGYLYISVGDKGVPKATGPDGRTIQLKGGGVVRCRPDGTMLEVLSSGTRNHLEPNLDARDTLFTYDNTDDGLGWWTRVVHHVDGGYYGYPFDYHDRKDKILPHMAEYGGGSPCGGLVYEEDAWPEDFRGRAFWSEWGKRSVRAFRFKPKGASFEVADVVEFVQPGDVESFRPIDLALSHDGETLYVADWSMGGWGEKKDQFGRVYAVTYAGEPIARKPRGKDADPTPSLIASLDHPARSERLRAQRELIRRGDAAYDAVTAALAKPETPETARRHLTWAVADIAPRSPRGQEPVAAALKDPSADVRAQAARAIGLNFGPVAADALVERLADPEAPVRLQAIIALGRIAEPSAVAALIPIVADPDAFLAFSARKALARIGDWEKVSKGLESPDPRVREGTLLALEGVYRKEAVTVLAGFAAGGGEASERALAVRRLASAARETPPWDGKWWGTQPAKGKPPAKTVEWEGTTIVLDSLRARLDDPASPVRIAAADAVAEVDDQPSKALIRARLPKEPDPEVRAALARALGGLHDAEALPILAAAVRDANGPDVVRDAALKAVEAIGGEQATGVLVEVLEDPALGDDRRKGVVAALGRFQAEAAVSALVKTLANTAPSVREAAVGALASVLDARKGDAPEPALAAIRARLDDPALEVRKRAIESLGTLADPASVPALIAAADREDVRFEAVEALAAHPNPAALSVYLGALGDRSPAIRKRAAAALAQLKDQAAPRLDQLAGRRELPAAALPDLREAFSVAAPIATWSLAGPFPIDAPPPFPLDQPIDPKAEMDAIDGAKVAWREAAARERRGRINLARIYRSSDKRSAFGVAEFDSPSDRAAKFTVGSDDTLTVWVNGEQVYHFGDSRSYSHESDHFDARLRKGPNRIVVRCGNNGGPWDFSVAVSGAVDYAFLKEPAAGGFDPEAYRVAAVKGGGDANHGKAIFHDLKGLACVKCHAVGPGGATVGPELSSVGAKYPRDELITAVLYPSAKISSGYEPVVLALDDGRVLSGIVKSETPEAVELQDSEAKTIKVEAGRIEERKRGDVSIMPPGLAEGISPADFADLIAFLETLKEVKPAAAPPAGSGG
ncbi:PVC-type heme-binding CxxCH protein [Paludisphaera mucosa]|uniref:HEAT repeat domain-containing protein n=1 Tax=Paludisphaera mucosa TaxID=3030827 RepID=A0ABT6FGZ3_9BACT|nr:PVC-type heme-binding CxxCH protein [Paludisphaera mucosa]MDG3006812.1 HEAT repeat domain-containing protein [Paludisphaera mucosa]